MCALTSPEILFRDIWFERVGPEAGILRGKVSGPRSPLSEDPRPPGDDVCGRPGPCCVDGLMLETGDPNCEIGLRRGLSTAPGGVGFSMVLTSRVLVGRVSGLVTELAIDTSELCDAKDVALETGCDDDISGACEGNGKRRNEL